MSDRPAISMVIPAHDEAQNIGALLSQALRVLPRLSKEFEIIVVDDGSTDATSAVAARYEGVRVLRHANNRGYGAALRTGLRAARLDWVFFTDADLQFDLGDLERLIDARDESDIVAGYRSPRRDPAGRRLLAWVWGKALHALWGLRVRDVDCAFKLLRRGVLDEMRLDSTGACVNPEILLRARQQGCRLRQVPVRHFPRRAGRASGARPRVLWTAARELLGLRARIPRRGERACASW